MAKKKFAEDVAHLKLPPYLQKLLKTPAGFTVVRLMSLAGILQTMAFELARKSTDGQMRQEDADSLLHVAMKTAHLQMQDPNAVMASLQYAQHYMVNHYEEATKQLAAATPEQVQEALPVVLPGNKFSLPHIDRHSLVVLCGFPAKTISQLIENAPSGYNCFRIPQLDALAPGDTELGPQIVHAMGQMQQHQDHMDLVVVEDLMSLTNQIPDNMAPNSRGKFGAAIKLMARAVKTSKKLAMLLLVEALDSFEIEDLKATGFRVIQWNESLFGPDVFFDKADAEKRLAESLQEFQAQQAKVRSALADAALQAAAAGNAAANGPRQGPKLVEQDETPSPVGDSLNVPNPNKIILD
jgi:hypothetical protein